jgi:hypothetical protein
MAAAPLAATVSVVSDDVVVEAGGFVSGSDDDEGRDRDSVGSSGSGRALTSPSRIAALASFHHPEALSTVAEESQSSSEGEDENSSGGAQSATARDRARVTAARGRDCGSSGDDDDDNEVEQTRRTPPSSPPASLQHRRGACRSWTPV